MISVEAIMSVISVILAGVGLTIPTIDYTFRRRNEKISLLATFAALIVAIFLFGYLCALTFNGEKYLIWADTLQVDFYGAFLSLAASIGAFLVVLASMGTAKSWSTAPSYYSLTLLALLGVYYLAFVNDLALLLAAWALIAVSGYVIAGLKKDSNSIEGAAKYSLMGSAASALMLFGIATVFSVTGTTNIISVSSLAGLSRDYVLIAIAGILLFTAAFGFKIGIVPFHGWLPDVYGGVHPILTAYLAGVIKVGGVISMLRVLYPFAAFLGSRWFTLFSLLSVITMTFGNVVGLVQRNVQRMMAYSSIAHVGYILVGVASLSTGSYLLGMQGIALMIFSYVFAKVGVFTSLSYFSRKKTALTLDGFRGVGKRMPILSLFLSMILFDLIGVPPFLGFWSKLYLFVSVVETAPWLTFIALINSGISVGYYVQVIRYLLFMEPTKESLRLKEKFSDPEVIVSMVCGLVLIISGLGPALILTPFLKL